MYFEMGDFPGLSEWVQCSHKGPYKSEIGESESEKRDETTERMFGEISFEDGGSGHRPRNWAASRSWKRQRKEILSRILQKERSPADTFFKLNAYIIDIQGLPRWCYW